MNDHLAPVDSPPAFLACGRLWGFLVWWLAVGVLMAVPMGPALGQDTGTPLGPVPRTSLDFLLTIPDDQVMVRYTPGSLDRAARLQFRLKDLYERINSWLPVGSPFAVFVLSPDDWKDQGLPRPYGMAQRVAAFAGAVPAWGTDDTVALWRELAGMTIDGSTEFTVRGSAEEVATVLLADSLVEFEMCRMIAINRGLAPAGRDPWVAEVVGHILCTSARRMNKEPSPVDLTVTLRRLRSLKGEPGKASLAGFDAELPLSQWLDYQARFVEASERVWQAEKKSGVRQLLKRWRKKGAPLSMADLTDLFPTLVEWRNAEWTDAPPQRPAPSGR
jgi:hypothetical protein